MMEGKRPVCDKDCFHCPYDDCILDELDYEDYKELAEIDRKLRNSERSEPQREKAVANKAYYEANREKLAAANKAYYEANREKLAARHKAYYEAHREELTAYQRNYYRKKKKQTAKEQER